MTLSKHISSSKILWAKTIKPIILISLIFTGFFLTLIVTASCSDSFTYKKRLSAFYELLDLSTIDSFEKGDAQSVVEYLDQKSQDLEFMKKYEALKKKEAIDLFNNIQTVQYFYHFFYQKKN